MNFLNKPAPEMLGDLEAQHSAAREKMARDAGFPSYEAMIAWERQRANPTGGTVPGKKKAAPMSVDTAMSWHPKVIFQNLADLLKGARQ